jgi:hypothetical protein
MLPESGDECVAYPEKCAGLFVDFESMRAVLEREYPAAEHAVGNACNFLHAALQHLEYRKMYRVPIRSCYADYGRTSGDDLLGSLHLMGFEARHSMRNSAENGTNMQMVIDVLQTMYTRADIEVYVLAVHERSYIDLVRVLQKNGRCVKLMTSFSCLSGDLRYNVGRENIIDLRFVERYLYTAPGCYLTGDRER